MLENGLIFMKGKKRSESFYVVGKLEDNTEVDGGGGGGGVINTSIRKLYSKILSAIIYYNRLPYYYILQIIVY